MSTEEGIKIDIEGEDEIEDVKVETEDENIENMEEPKDDPKEAAEAAKETEGAETEAAQEQEPESEEHKDEKKKHGKKDKKDKKDPRDEKIADLEDRVKRQMAEFENFRKRTDKEKSQMFDMGAKSVVEKILPVIDNFERGLSNIPEGADEAFVNGMKMIYKQMTDELDKIGVKPIEAVGQPFDPNIHNAVMQTESDEYESGTVAQELQKGYMYHETLVRPSMVSVVQ